MALCSEVAMTDAEKESEARCKAMLNELISVVKKQTMEMEDLAVRMDELAVGLKAIVQPPGAPAHALPPPVPASTATCVTAVDHAVAAATPRAAAALAPESPTKCSMMCSGDDTALQTSAFMPDAALSSSSTTARLDVTITSPEPTVATIRVRDGTSDLAAHQLLEEMPLAPPATVVLDVGSGVTKTNGDIALDSYVTAMMKMDKRQPWSPPKQVEATREGVESRPAPGPMFICYEGGEQLKQPPVPECIVRRVIVEMEVLTANLVALPRHWVQMQPRVEPKPPWQSPAQPRLTHGNGGDAAGAFQRNLCINSPTGSGKTLAYALPIVQILSTQEVWCLRALVVLSTRDLALQVKEVFDASNHDSGVTPLSCAVCHGKAIAVRYFLDKGADPNKKDSVGVAPLYDAAKEGYDGLARLLLSKGASVDVSSSEGTPLHVAASNGKSGVVKILLEHQANPNKVSADLGTPLATTLCATPERLDESACLKCMKLLVEAGADLNCTIPDTPLVIATSKGLTFSVRYLLEVGANANIPSNHGGSTPIEIAANSGRRKLVESLFPFTSPIQAVSNWSVEGIIAHVKSIHLKDKGKQSDEDRKAQLKAHARKAVKEEYAGASKPYTEDKASDKDRKAQLKLCGAKAVEGTVNISATYNTRHHNIKSSVVARGDLWRLESSRGGSTFGNDSAPLFLVQLGPLLFVPDSTLLLPVHLSKQHLLWYGYDRKNGMHSLCPAIWSKHNKWLLMSMMCLNPVACSFMDVQFPIGQLTYVASEGITASGFFPLFGGVLQAHGKCLGETKQGTRIQKCCPSHKVEGTPRCCSCERMEPRESRYVLLDDGRKLSLRCLESAVMDTSECQPLYLEIHEIYEGLNMKVEQQYKQKAWVVDLCCLCMLEQQKHGRDCIQVRLGMAVLLVPWDPSGNGDDSLYRLGGKPKFKGEGMSHTGLHLTGLVVGRGPGGIDALAESCYKGERETAIPRHRRTEPRQPVFPILPAASAPPSPC